MLTLLRETPSLRRFFVAFFQSQVGNSAATVALLLIAYQRLHSGWGISLVLLGVFLPGILLAPVFGSLADRTSRRRMVICADVLRGCCFAGLAVVPPFPAIVAAAAWGVEGSPVARRTKHAKH